MILPNIVNAESAKFISPFFVVVSPSSFFIKSYVKNVDLYLEGINGQEYLRMYNGEFFLASGKVFFFLLLLT